MICKSLRSSVSNNLDSTQRSRLFVADKVLDFTIVQIFDWNEEVGVVFFDL